MQAKIFKREKERLYLDDKDLVTSKGLLRSVGAALPDVKPKEDSTDMRLLADDERNVDFTVKQL